MERRRKRDLVIGISLSILLSSIYTTFSIKLVTLAIGEPLELMIATLVWVALSLPVFCWGTYLIAVRDERKALKYGIVLTNDTLSLWGFEIPVDRISRVDVKEYGITSHYLAIEYSYQGRKRVKTRTSLTRGTSTDDIMELCNKIRELKGWPEQVADPLYGFDWHKFFQDIGRHLRNWLRRNRG
jgi:hypothetical protein